MNCDQLMKSHPHCLSDRDTARHAAEVMRDENIGFIPICDDEGKVVGAVTDRDIVVRVAADGGELDMPLGDFMSRDLVVCRASDDLAHVEQVMATHHKSRVVCVDDRGRAAGVLSLSDIAQYEKAERAGDLLRSITKRETTQP